MEDLEKYEEDSDSNLDRLTINMDRPMDAADMELDRFGYAVRNNTNTMPAEL